MKNLVKFDRKAVDGFYNLAYRRRVPLDIKGPLNRKSIRQRIICIEVVI